MLSTLYAHAEVPDRDAHLMLRLGQQLKDAPDHSTASLFRFAIANDSGALYRLVIISATRNEDARSSCCIN